jgi:hypothetical protein
MTPAESLTKIIEDIATARKLMVEGNTTAADDLLNVVIAGLQIVRSMVH